MQGSPETAVSAGLVAICIVAIATGSVLAILMTVLRARERRRRFELIETALRSQNLQPDVQRDLVRSLQPVRGRATFVLGWFGLFGGIGWMCTDPRADDMRVAVVVTVVSFAMLTLPFALRELETRKA